MSYPAPIGGLALPPDLAPSIFFAVLYALLLPLVFYRVFDRHSRTTLLLGSIIVSIERIIFFSLRAVQTQQTNKRLSNSLLKYTQISLGVGYIGITSDLLSLFRCLLVNPTFGLERWEEAPAHLDSELPSSCFQPPHKNERDRPRERFWARRLSDFTNLAFWGATVPAFAGGVKFDKADFGNEQKGRELKPFLYASASLILFLMLIIQIGTTWSRLNQPRHLNNRAIRTIRALSVLTSIVAIYRLSTIHRTSPLGSLDSTPNTHASKTTFYTLHILPEWISITTLLAFNTRKIFGTGKFGDTRSGDDGPQDIVRRKRRAGKKAEKLGEEAVGLAVMTS
ncbi:hypothetical protein MD484_g7749, partial [Candolleomyces efflorescens]